MKIAIDASRYGHKSATGVEWYSFHIINHLIQENKEHEFLLYCRDKIDIEESERVKLRVIKNKRLWTILGLTNRIFKDKPDCLFVPSHTLPILLPKRSAIMIHDLAFKRYRDSYKLFQYLYLDLSTRFAVRFSSRILVPSDATKNDLIRFYKCDPKKISTIYHGFDSNEYLEEKDMKKASKFSAKIPYLLFVGRIETKKNISKILKAFERIKEKYSDFSLILAGKPGVGYPEIEKQISTMKHKQDVILPGYISEEEKRYLYKNAVCFVFPSLFEGFGFPVLEAFASKCPVVCSDSGSLPEVCGEACMLTNNNDDGALYENIFKLIENKEIREKLINMGLNRLSFFDWEKCAKETLKALTV
ncbi:MAG: glycosyltransferase family 1 protein [Candidatus Gracilibacteria bacterium]|jgi:glycosyltransferase involved in cell wall biosynthesis|nr:glycosyltransferase family 1 protein [Candidatus Gracilibacteria bacterium]